MNIQLAITEGAKILKDKFVKNPFLDSELLMSKVVKKDKKYLLLNHDQEVKIEDLKYFKKLIEKRANGQPIAYLINKKFFWKSEFYVTNGTLIPRPDTEVLVEQVLKLYKYKDRVNILEIGIGSGCILLSILKEKVNSYGTGIDISKNCLNISKINAKYLNVEARLKLFKTNVDKFNLGKYDLIISNPPYIKKHSLKYLERDVVGFEPHQALDGGIDGLSEIRKVIKKSSELIKKNGKFVLEIGFDQKNKVINILKKEGFYINNILRDLANNYRCIVSTKII